MKSAFLFLDPKTLSKDQLERLYEDIKKRIRWNKEQLNRMCVIKFEPWDNRVSERKESYSNAITQYRTDLTTISKILK